jgi:hypothetical protein
MNDECAASEVWISGLTVSRVALSTDVIETKYNQNHNIQHVKIRELNMYGHLVKVNKQYNFITKKVT